MSIASMDKAAIPESVTDMLHSFPNSEVTFSAFMYHAKNHVSTFFGKRKDRKSPKFPSREKVSLIFLEIFLKIGEFEQPFTKQKKKTPRKSIMFHEIRANCRHCQKK